MRAVLDAAAALLPGARPPGRTRSRRDDIAYPNWDVRLIKEDPACLWMHGGKPGYQHRATPAADIDRPTGTSMPMPITIRDIGASDSGEPPPWF